jgi:hypothetical protein
VTVTAINAVITNVVLMTKLHRLIDRHIQAMAITQVEGIPSRRKPEDSEHYRHNANTDDGIGTTMKHLSHELKSYLLNGVV